VNFCVNFLREFFLCNFQGEIVFFVNFLGVWVREFLGRCGCFFGWVQPKIHAEIHASGIHAQNSRTKFTHQKFTHKIHARNSRTKNSRTKFTHEIHAPKIHAENSRTKFTQGRGNPKRNVDDSRKKCRPVPNTIS